MARTKTSSAHTSADLDLGPYLMEPTSPLDWPAVFGNDNPVEVEIGSGKGLFLISAATQKSARNYFGVEIAPKFARFAADRLAKQSLANARIARADARRVLTEWIADASVAVLHIYFPDPWWKRRHRKRRVFNEHFVADAARILQPGGELRFASDVEEYFDVMQELVSQHPAFVALESSPSLDPQNGVDCLTNFERKYRKVGKTIFRANFRRTEHS